LTETPEQGGKSGKLSDQKAPRKISAKSIMEDLKAGMADSDLMEKYKLSFQGLQDLFSKLVQANLATDAYFSKRAMKQASRPLEKEKNPTCPYCGYSAAEKFVRCPRCGQDTTEWLDTVELTKILSFE